MSDITMCYGDNCPIHLQCNCYRYTALPEYHQTYVRTFIEDGNEECSYFMERGTTNENNT